MTSDKISITETGTIRYELNICSHLIHMLSSLGLGLGPDPRLRFHVADELYFLLKRGPIELEKHRNNNNWWG